MMPGVMSGSSVDIVEAGVIFCDIFSEIHAESFRENERWSSPAFRSFFDQPGTLALIASVNGEPAGFILARQVSDEAEILTLAVRGMFRRQGIAGGLIGALQNRLREIRPIRLFLEVSTLNEAAKALYHVTGFEKAGHRPRYYADGSGADIMIWEP